ncbi:MAG TPA: single-stranded DNA-binding protein [Candidatus Faecicola pullistercoris]|nr:single-stranded DNA-binding protein [Candidatus Faecicola pullistercoris]
MNKVFLIGNLTKDPELNQTANGIYVCKFTLAITRRFSNTDGNKETDFLPIIVWRTQAERCGKYLKKGSKAAVSGSIQTRSYDQDGSRRYITEIIADEVQFLDRRSDNSLEEGESDGDVFSDLKAVDAKLPF